MAGDRDRFGGHRIGPTTRTRSAARGRRSVVIIAVVLAVLLTGLIILNVLRTVPGAGSAPPATSAAGTPTGDTSAEPPARSPGRPDRGAGTALAAAGRLTVKGRAPKTGYSRDEFGSAWVDTDHNGCDQRDDVLNRDLITKTFDGCVVLTGILHDPYTGTTIHFRRGPTTSAAVQIDHVVAESDAWQKGAQQWSAAQRLRFANDTLNLLAVDGPTNAAKGDGDTATWLPSNKPFRCSYVARQVAVKTEYRLWVTAAEQQAMVRVLSRCPSMRLPVRAAVPAHRVR